MAKRAAYLGGDFPGRGHLAGVQEVNVLHPGPLLYLQLCDWTSEVPDNHLYATHTKSHRRCTVPRAAYKTGGQCLFERATDKP